MNCPFDNYKAHGIGFKVFHVLLLYFLFLPD